MRKLPGHALEATEVAIERHDRGAMLEGKRRKVRVADEVARRPRASEQSPQERDVTAGWLRCQGLRSRKPPVEDFRRLLGGERWGEDCWMGGESQERQVHDPGKGDRLAACKRAPQPVPRDGVLACALIDGVQQDVG